MAPSTSSSPENSRERGCDSRARWGRVRAAAIAVMASIALSSHSAAVEPEGAENHLAGQTSPYLIQHARNPVDWYPWGDEAFAKAEAEGKPVFLSIGYSTCHWCHVMAKESFEDAAIAAFMNEHFVCIKVDREERPDVDQVYVSFVAAQTGRAGWPLSVFLTGARKPFVGGTYFPPDRFKAALQLVSQQWATSREALIAHGDEALSQLSTAPAAATTTAAGSAAPETAALVDRAFAAISRSYDAAHGGFGEAPKFPRPVTLRLLARLRERAQASQMLSGTLAAMARGGIHDQLGGGFHRYAVDAAWRVPHFEKMLYDQAQLADAYLDGWQLTGDAELRAAAKDTLEYVVRDLQLADGGFATAEDADSAMANGGHGEGAFYAWTKDQIDSRLIVGLGGDGADAAKLFSAIYGVGEHGNVPPDGDPAGELRGKNVLRRAVGLSDAAAACGIPADRAGGFVDAARDILFTFRATRPRPARDEKLVSAWNGLMISALARGSAILDEPGFLAAAQRATAFLRTHAWTEAKGLTRSYCQGEASGEAVASDYAFLIAGLLDLHAVDGDPAHLSWALELQARFERDFLDPASGTYLDSAAGAKLPVRMRADDDQAEPAANSVAARNLLRLARITEDPALSAQARKLLAAYRVILARRPDAMPAMLSVMISEAAPSCHLLVVGDPDEPMTRALLATAQRRFLPDLVVVVVSDAPASASVRARYPAIMVPPRLEKAPTAYFCSGTTCDAPTSDPAVLAKQLEEAPTPSGTAPGK